MLRDATRGIALRDGMLRLAQPQSGTLVERVWHTNDSQGRILALKGFEVVSCSLFARNSAARRHTATRRAAER